MIYKKKLFSNFRSCYYVYITNFIFIIIIIFFTNLLVWIGVV